MPEKAPPVTVRSAVPPFTALVFPAALMDGPPLSPGTLSVSQRPFRPSTEMPVTTVFRSLVRAGGGGGGGETLPAATAARSSIRWAARIGVLPARAAPSVQTGAGRPAAL